MSITTKIIVQQILNIDDTKATASKFPRYTVTLGNSISSITASELVSSIEAAAKSAAAAKDSEIAAKTSELNAKNSEREAAISAGASEESATQSATSATQSAASADKSAESAAAAKTSETNAKASETKAKTSETNAKTSETNAKTSETNAKASEDKAKASETNAATSAAAAKISEDKAKISETNAAASASDSKGYRDGAEIFSAQAAASASAAKTSETNAKTSETNAKTSETNAKTSETNAAHSATSASQSVTTIQGLKSDVEQLKSDTQAIKNSAVTETAALKSDVEQLKLDTQGIKDSAVTETTALKNAAAASAAQASNNATEAGQQASNAASSAQSASTYAGRAEVAAGKAESIIGKSLLKENNLSDLQDKDQARLQLNLNTFRSLPEQTLAYSPDNSIALRILNNEWGCCIVSDGSPKPLTVEYGGTGVASKEAFRQSYNVPTKDESLLSENNLSDLADRAAAWLNVRPTGSTPLAGDPVGDYDAVTKRWVENKLNTGTVGPTMNGVMNYGVGDFHLRDSRAYIQPYEVVSDGQLLKRADWPELWAYAQMVGAISDDVWVSDVRQRGKYSTGNGTTTFRVPDRNGVQLNSIKALFGRGDGGGAAGQAGSVSEAAAPNITGSFPGAIAGAYESAINTYSSRFGLTGAIGAENGLGIGRDGLNKSGAIYTPDNTYGFSFDAGVADRVYGRYGIKGTIIPNSFIGVWVIRASGGFVAANTSWSVINADASAPAVSTTVLGGKLTSQYRVGATDTYRMSMYSQGAYAQNLVGVIAVENQLAGKTDVAHFNFGLDGAIRLGKATGGSSTSAAYGYTPFRAQDWWNTSPYGAFVPIVGGGTGGPGGAWRSYTALGTLTMGSDINTHPNAMLTQCWDYNLSTGASPNGNAVRNTIFNGSNYDITFGDNAGTVNYIFSKSPISDRNKKKDIESLGTSIALENIKQMEYTSFKYIYDKGNQVRRGFIAQQLEEIDSQYVRKYESSDGSTSLALDENVLLLDALAAIQNLSNQIEELKLQIAELNAQ